ncbi:MAG: hypothetical protein H6R27_675 [Proteobacteria bacterium]|nr:hypothetical protein [Pseudomonadota bacterium]
MVASVKVTCRTSSRSIGAADRISAMARSAAALSNSSSRGPTASMPAAASAANARSFISSAKGTSKVGRARAATPYLSPMSASKARIGVAESGVGRQHARPALAVAGVPVPG